MSEERDQTIWTQTLKAYGARELTQEHTAPTTGANPYPPVPDLDEETQLSDGPPVLPHTELTQPANWQHEPTQTLGPIAAEQDPAFHLDETVKRAPPAIPTDETVLLAPIKPKPKRKRRRSRKRDALTLTAAKSGVAGLVVAIVLSASVLILAMLTL